MIPDEEKTWSSWPWSARWCMWFTYAQVLSCLVAHAFYDVGPRYKAVNEDEIDIFNVARKVLVVPLVLLGLFQFIEMSSRKPRSRALVISRVSMLEFSVKITYYTALSYGYDLAYQNQRCYDYRPIYITRWLGWTFAIPILLFMNLYPIMDKQSSMDVVRRIFPQQAASAAYCWACALGSVIIDPWMGWFLNSLGCVAYAVVIVDEVVLVSEHLLATTQPFLKGYSNLTIRIIIKESVFVIYTCFYLAGLWSFASSYACQRFYTVSDVSLKATMASLLFLYWNVDGCPKEDDEEKAL